MRWSKYRSRPGATEVVVHADPLEKEISGAIRTALERIGCDISTTEQRRRSGVTIGIPDLYCRWPAHGVRCWIEVKRPGEKPTAIQRAWHDAERAAGGVVIVATSAAEAVEAVCELKARAKGGGMTMSIEPQAGSHIRDVLAEAVATAIESRRDVSFDFNGVTHTVQAGDSYETAQARAERVLGHAILTREQEAERAKRELAEMEVRQAADIADAAVPTEEELRAAKVPWPKSEEELTEYIRSLVDRPHDYGTCVYAMSMAAVAAFQYVAHALGTTGFQAGCADMDILRRTRNLEHGFRIVDYGNLLYPQYWTPETTPIYEAVLRNDPAPWVEAAAKKLDGDGAHPEVRDHWKRILEYEAA